jgi:hypothetical protein
MKILLLATPISPEVRDLSPMYFSAQILEERYKHIVHVAYSKVQSPPFESEYFFCFEEWVNRNIDFIEETNIEELEQHFPYSHLWKAAVVNRFICDYSYLEGLFPYKYMELDAILFKIKSVILFYSELILENQYDAVLAHAGDNMHSTVLFELSKSLNYRCYAVFALLNEVNKKHFLFDQLSFKSSVWDWLTLSYLDSYDETVKPFEEKIQRKITELIEYRAVKENPDIYYEYKYINRLKNYYKNGVRYIIRNFISGKNKNLEDQCSFKNKTKSKIKELINTINVKISIDFTKNIPNRPFLFFPLHLQPEASLLSTTPVFSDQLGLIRAISVSLPAGYLLVIKDYPLQWERPISFYKNILSLPNTILLPKEMPIYPLLERMEMLIAISGSSGFESLLRGKKVLLFGEVFYQELEGVTQVSDLRNLSHVIKQALFSDIDTRYQRKMIFAFLKALEDIQYDREYESEKHDWKDYELGADMIHNLFTKQENYYYQITQDKSKS